MTDDRTPRIEAVLLRRLEDIGAARHAMKEVLLHSLFESLSKHHPLWNPSGENTLETLDDIRCQLLCILDHLEEVAQILEGSYNGLD